MSCHLLAAGRSCRASQLRLCLSVLPPLFEVWPLPPTRRAAASPVQTSARGVPRPGPLARSGSRCSLGPCGVTAAVRNDPDSRLGRAASALGSRVRRLRRPLCRSARTSPFCPRSRGSSRPLLAALALRSAGQSLREPCRDQGWAARPPRAPRAASLASVSGRPSLRSATCRALCPLSDVTPDDFVAVDAPSVDVVFAVVVPEPRGARPTAPSARTRFPARVRWGHTEFSCPCGFPE